jgi:hypothetical protein
MAELVPIFGGLLAGCVVGYRTRGGWSRIVRVGVTSVGLAVCAGLLSGELPGSPEFLVIDLPIALLAQAVGVFAVDAVQERASRTRA